ncbi:MAG: hypothetical protein AB8B71_14260 [Paracoccaceae bacterium]
MKANFALSMSFDGICLVHRAAGGWRFVGEAALEDPDLVGTLAKLRETALSLEPAGLRSKLIIPAGQIKYLTLDTPGADDAARWAAAEEALIGATPYDVSELAYDISPDGDQTHVAAVAKETLAEAEDFAVSNRFVPISFVAVPEDEPFLGEPFFGPTQHVLDMHGPEQRIEPDHIAVVVLADIATQDGPVADVSERPDAKLLAQDPSGPAQEDKISNTPSDKAEIGDTPEPEDPTPVLGFASRRANTSEQGPSLGGVSRDFATGRDQTSAPVSINAASLPEADFEDTAPAIEPSALAPTAVAPSVRASARRTAVVQPNFKPPRDERQQMTIFGARGTEDDVVIGGKPRFLGLAVTAGLLVFLAGVAAWATVFREDGLAGFFAPTVPDVPVIADDIDIAPITVAPEAQIETASLPAEIQTPDVAPLPAPNLAIAPPTRFDPETAAEHYAVTGIWTSPPIVPTPPTLISLEDLYITSIDHANLSFDAVALTQPTRRGIEQTFRAPSNPAPAGTSFALDRRGLVIPTPQGSLSPDGVLVVLGRPDVVPPDTPERAEIVAPEAALSVARPELAAYRPRTRPDDLIEQTERQQLGGLSRQELAEVRPQARPQAEASDTPPETDPIEDTATALAIAQSARPALRPRNLAPAPSATPKPEDTDREVASVAPRTVSPSVPSATSVAKQATVKNAINLKKINLMGVYGTPSNRRALIRLSNGRYKKVKVGDRIDGGRISAIGEGELRYQKGSRNVVLRMPKT